MAEGEEVPCWAEVFFGHGEGEVEDEEDVADDASLEGGGVAEESVGKRWLCLLCNI